MKIDYTNINWDARTNWCFCGSYENLREIWRRYLEYVDSGASIEEFGYKAPRKGLAFGKGDVVRYTRDNGEQVLAVVDIPLSICGHTYIILPDGHKAQISSDDIPKRVVTAGIPDELMALARAEAGKRPDLDKCPLKKAGVCMETM